MLSGSKTSADGVVEEIRSGQWPTRVVNTQECDLSRLMRQCLPWRRIEYRETLRNTDTASSTDGNGGGGAPDQGEDTRGMRESTHARTVLR